MLRLLNARSMRNKTLSIKDVVVEQDIALTMLRSSTALGTVVYRPPPSRNNNCTVTMFFNEFPLLTENLTITAGPILFAGDFNFHVDNNQDCTATRFTQLLYAFNLKQNILLPIHLRTFALIVCVQRCCAGNATVICLHFD